MEVIRDSDIKDTGLARHDVHIEIVHGEKNDDSYKGLLCSASHRSCAVFWAAKRRSTEVPTLCGGADESGSFASLRMTILY